MTLASDLQKLKRLRELTAMEPQSVMRDEELADIDQQMSDRQMQFLAMQSAQMDANPMSGLQQFTTSAGIQANRMYEGAKDFLGVGDPQQRQAEIGQQKLVDQAIAQRSPGINLAGNITGGVLAAAPLAIAGEGVAPVSMGILGRTALSTGLGGAESGLMLPDKDQGETRFTNMGEGMLFGAVSEPVATGISIGLKKAYSALKNTGVLASAPMQDQVKDALQESGVDITALKPETQEMLSKLTSTDDVDAAINQAIETEFGFKLTTGQQTGDFDTLRAEQAALRNSDEFRDFTQEQTDGIFAAADDIAVAQGGTDVSMQGGVEGRDQTGGVVKGALEETRQADKRQYQELYTAANALSEEIGAELPVKTDKIQNALVEMMRDYGNTHTDLLKSIEAKLSSYQAARPGTPISNPFDLEDVEARQLSLTNNETLIQELNSLYDPSDRRAARIVETVKNSIIKSADDAMEVFESQLQFAPDMTTASREALETARQARASRRSYSQLWENKDVLQDLTDSKSKSTTDRVSPSAVFQKVTQSPEGAAQVVNLLDERQASGAIAELRTFALKDLFDQSIEAGRTTSEMISGKKLRKKLNAKATTYKALLGEDQFNALQGLVTQIEKATYVPRAAENTSNTSYETMGRIAQLFANVAQPGAGMAVGMFDAKGIADAARVSSTTRGALDTNQQPDLFGAISNVVPSVNLPGDIALQLKLDDSNHTAFNLLMRQYLGTERQEQEGALSE